MKKTFKENSSPTAPRSSVGEGDVFLPAGVVFFTLLFAL